MQYLHDILITTSGWVRPHLYQVAMALLATILVIYGDNINRAVKKQTSSMHLLFRLSIFILLCAFGYGAATVALTPLIAKLLASISSMYLSAVILGLFIALGIIAERKRQI